MRCGGQSQGGEVIRTETVPGAPQRFLAFGAGRRGVTLQARGSMARRGAMVRDINRVIGWSGPRVRSNRRMVSSPRIVHLLGVRRFGPNGRRHRSKRQLRASLRGRQTQGDGVVGTEHPAGAAQGVFPDDVGLFVLCPARSAPRSATRPR